MLVIEGKVRGVHRLSAAQMACLAQLLISLCLILAVTASRLSAHCV